MMFSKLINNYLNWEMITHNVEDNVVCHFYGKDDKGVVQQEVHDTIDCNGHVTCVELIILKGGIYRFKDETNIGDYCEWTCGITDDLI